MLRMQALSPWQRELAPWHLWKDVSPNPVDFILWLPVPSQLPQTIPVKELRGGLAPAHSPLASPFLRADAALP